MAKYSIEESTLTNIANAIRAKTGGTAALTPAAMDEALNSIPTQAAKTVTPSTADQTAVAKGVFTTGAVTVKGDANLKAENIAEGVSIFNVAGSHKGGTDIQTCTVQVNVFAGSPTIKDILYTKFEDGVISAVYIAQATPPFTLNNVICGSCIHLYNYGDRGWGSFENGVNLATNAPHLYAKVSDTPGTTTFSAIGGK